MTTTPGKKTPSVTRAELVESVQQLVDYLYDDESEDYAQSNRGRQQEHIFSALQMLHRWLREQAVSAGN